MTARCRARAYGQGDGPCRGVERFGFSEQVEGELADIAQEENARNVSEDWRDLHNHERRRTEGTDHVWSNNGRATIVKFPL